MNIADMLKLVVDKNASDLHLVLGSPPTIRIDGVLQNIPDTPALTHETIKTLVEGILTEEQKDFIQANKELDFGYQFQDKARFRVNVYMAKGAWCAALRLIPNTILTAEKLNLLPIFSDFSKYKQGLVLLVGPTGEGKSTTLAAIIEEINQTRSEHIVTVEDPIEFVYYPKKSIVSQRELNHDTTSWQIALRSVLREDPDVVLIGELRDYETIALALTVAETGHLVFATLHTSTAAETIDRIVDVFPAAQQGQIRQQLASSLKVVASQRLLPALGGGRIPAFEIMVATSAVRNLIREAKTFQIDNAIQTGVGNNMILFEHHLKQLAVSGRISKETAYENAFRREEMERIMPK